MFVCSLALPHLFKTQLIYHFLQENFMLSIVGLGGHSNSPAEYENGCLCLILKGNPDCDCVYESLYS